MNKPHILIPQEVPAIFAEAAEEKNWLIFAIGVPDSKGKRAKRPVVTDRPYIWTNRDSAAKMTLKGALDRLKAFREWDGGLDKINKKAAKRREDMIAEGKKPGPEIIIEGYALGYFPREDSALVALDFDNVVHAGEIIDFEIGAMIEETSAYVERSSSGTGLRVLMPRQWGDETHQRGEKNDVGLFVSSKGAACALTFDTVQDGTGRDDRLFQLVLDRGGETHEEVKTADVEDMVLEHGRIEVETFLGMVDAIENDDRFDGFDEWLGMVRGAKEYYEIVDPERLDEVRAAVEAWCESWKGGDHDPDKFEDVWERKARAGSKAGLGSWVHCAQADGWSWPGDTEVKPEEVDEWAFLKKLDTEQVGPSGKKVTRPIANYMNCVRVFRHMPKLRGLIGRNVLTGGFVRLREWNGEPLDYPREWTDIDMHRAIQTVQGARKGGAPIFAHFPLDGLKQGIEGGAQPVQPIKSMIERLPEWDGTQRIDTWLTDYFGVEDTRLHRAYARKFLIALIARGHAMPGALVKADTVLVLTGKQGMNKSQFFSVLAGSGDLFTDHVGEITRKESAENIAGRWICELAEGEIVTKADRRALKGFLAREADKYRPSYGRNVQTFPRACVFVMPTNDDEVLNDPTGSRRYWPVTATQTAPISALRMNRLQLLAEAKAAYEAREVWWLTEAEDAEREALAADYEVSEPIAEHILPVLENVIDGQVVSQTEVMAAAGFDVGKGGNGVIARVVRELFKKWGWERCKVNGKRGYRRADRDTYPVMSDKAREAMKEGQVLPLPVSSEFSKIE